MREDGGDDGALSLAGATVEIERRGGHLAVSVGGNIDHVVVGADPASRRDAAKAEEAGTPVEAAFADMPG